MPKISYKYRTKEAAPSMIFRALANDIRLQILSLLRKSEKCVSELTEGLGYDQTTISHSLSFLAACGFVKVRRVGQSKIYSLSSRRIEKLFELIEEHLEENRKQIADLLKKEGRTPKFKILALM